MSDYYTTLGISKDASAEEIKKAYRQMALKYHPDRNKEKDAEDKFKKASEAYSVLSDPQKRQHYDQYGTADTRRFNEGFRSWSSGFGDFDDVFSSFFGGGFSRGRQKSSSVQSNIEITLEESYHGVTKTVNFSTSVECEKCKGIGGDSVSCSSCGGYGKVRRAHGFVEMITACEMCRGLGKRVTKKCSQCNGRGHIKKPKSVSVKIPRGIEDGTGLRVSGQGNQERNKLPGDLIVGVRVTPHAFFKREGAHLSYAAHLSFAQACLGDTISVKTIGGEEITVKIPPGAQFGQMFRIKGKGMPSNGSYGNLFVVADIKIPKKLSVSAKKALKKFDQLLD